MPHFISQKSPKISICSLLFSFVSAYSRERIKKQERVYLRVNNFSNVKKYELKLNWNQLIIKSEEHMMCNDLSPQIKSN